MPEEPRKTRLFISHRSQDFAPARIIAERINSLSNQVEIFLAGDPEFEGPRVGRPIGESLKKALGTTSLVLLLYSGTEEDWSWCMWECGVATDPHDETPTDVIPLSLTGEPCPVYVEKLNVNTTSLDSLQDFVNQLCTEHNFFPDLNGPLTDRERNDRFLREQAEILFERLKPYVSTPVETGYRFEGFTIHVSEEIMGLTIEGEPPRGKRLQALLENTCITNPRGDGAKHFGYAQFEEGLTLADLRKRWEQERGDARLSNKAWTEVIADEIWRIGTVRDTDLTWDPFRSVRDRLSETRKALWVHPVIHQYRKLPDRSFEFDLLVMQTRAPVDPVNEEICEGQAERSDAEAEEKSRKPAKAKSKATASAKAASSSAGKKSTKKTGRAKRSRKRGSGPSSLPPR